MTHTRKYARTIKDIPGLNSSAVGVKFYFKDETIDADARRLNRHRYCQVLCLNF